MRRPKNSTSREGSALLIALGSVLVLSLLVGTLVFDMKMESDIASYYRKRLKTSYLAQGGIEWAKLMLIKSSGGVSEEEEYGEAFYIQLKNLQRGMGVSGVRQDLGEGFFTVNILPEQGRRNVNQLTEEDWKSLLEQAHVPDDDWDDLIGAFMDWTDKGDTSRLNGAESDDEFYQDRDYEVKNAPLDTIDELLLIKGFDERVVYGGPAYEEGDPPIIGIAQWLTTWGTGKVNANTASADVLMTMPELDEYNVQNILEGRGGIDGIPGTEDDGFASVQEMLALVNLDDDYAQRFTVTERRYIRIVSIGESNGVRYGIWSIFQQEGRELIPVYWQEEFMP